MPTYDFVPTSDLEIMDTAVSRLLADIDRELIELEDAFYEGLFLDFGAIESQNDYLYRVEDVYHAINDELDYRYEEEVLYSDFDYREAEGEFDEYWDDIEDLIDEEDANEEILEEVIF